MPGTRIECSSACIWLIASLFFSVCSADATYAWQTNATLPWHTPGAEIESQQLKFSNGNVHLVGTVYLPRTGDHLPAVVVLHSAVAATRDAGLYRHLREGLPAIGFAVLVYDRRGSGESTGSLENISYTDLADDAIAGQKALASIPRIDPARIGFWGLSQGGWLAVQAAGRSPSARFAISVSAPLVPAEEQMRFAIANLLTIRGYSVSDISQMLDTRAAWTGYLRGANSRDVALSALKKAESAPWFNLTYMPTASELTTDPEHNSYRKEMDEDPFVAAAKVKVPMPMLFIFGDSDPWIPVARSMEKLQELAKRQHNFEYAVIPDANHEMMSPAGERMEMSAESVRNNEPQIASYFILLGSWLSRQAGK